MCFAVAIKSVVLWQFSFWTDEIIYVSQIYLACRLKKRFHWWFLWYVCDSISYNDGFCGTDRNGLTLPLSLVSISCCAVGNACRFLWFALFSVELTLLAIALRLILLAEKVARIDIKPDHFVWSDAFGSYFATLHKSWLYPSSLTSYRRWSGSFPVSCIDEYHHRFPFIV